MNRLVQSGTLRVVLSGTGSSCYRGPKSPVSQARSAACGARNFTNVDSFGIFLTDPAICPPVDKAGGGTLDRPPQGLRNGRVGLGHGAECGGQSGCNESFQEEGTNGRDRSDQRPPNGELTHSAGPGNDVRSGAPTRRCPNASSSQPPVRRHLLIHYGAIRRRPPASVWNCDNGGAR